jgi:KaiC/GvpD/RAD55 family RecA-like ATPase
MRWISDFKDENTAYAVALRLGAERGTNQSFGPCPSCGADRRGSSDARKPCTTDREGQGWHCWACSTKGDALDILAWDTLKQPSKGISGDDWEQLRQKAVQLGMIRDQGNDPTDRKPAPIRSARSLLTKPAAPPPDPPAPKGRFAWHPELAKRCSDALWGAHEWAGRARNYLRAARCLSEEAIKSFGLGLYVDEQGNPVLSDAGRPYVTIPLHDKDGKCVNVRFRSIGVAGTCEHCSSNTGCKKCREYRVCQGRPLPLFGANRLTGDPANPVLITEGEFDVIAMWDYGFQVNVVSGTGGAGTWLEDWLDLLEPYHSLISLYDPDESGEKGWKAASAKLGTYRCSRATLPGKDPNECLFQKVPVEVIERAIQQAKPEHGINFRTVDSFQSDLETLIEHPELLRGRPTGSVKLDSLIGGWRPGIEVITGESGHGKTTITTWMLYEQAKAGVGVALTSFEQQSIGTVQKLLRMEVGQDFTRVSREERQDAMARVGSLPLYILDHYGQITAEKMIETMRYAKRRLGVTMFLVDHLGFLIDPDTKDERLAIQAVMRTLAIFAKNESVTIFLIVHPGNTNPEQSGRYSRVGMRNLKGASAIRQDADDVLVVVREPANTTKGQRCKREWPQARIYGDKIRSEFGITGNDVALAFDPGSCICADSWDLTPAGKNGWLVPRTSEPQEDPPPPPEKPTRRKARDPSDTTG